MSGRNREIETQLQQLIENWAYAVRRHDIEGVVAHHAPDILMFDVVGETKLQGMDAYRASWVELFFPWHGETGRFELRELNVRAGDGVGFATALLDCAGIENGKQVAYTLRLTIGLEQVAGEWLVVHEHHSEPLQATSP